MTKPPYDNPWSAPIAPLAPADSRPGNSLSAIAEGTVIGVIVGIVDIHVSGLGSTWDVIYFALGMVMGARRGSRAWLAWPFQGGVCLYLIHLIAIAQGYKQPYVEANAKEAIWSLLFLVSAGIGIGSGVLIRSGVKSLLAILKKYR